MRPVILCDVDEVVADLLPAWLCAYNTAYDDNLSIDSITDWDLTKFVKPECGDKVYDIIRDDLFYDRVSPIRGASLGVYRLRHWGYRVVFVTSCIRGSADSKIRWLTRYGFIDDSRTPDDVWCGKDKSLLRGDLLIDDGPHNILAAKAVGMKTILMSQPYNMNVIADRRAYGWSDLMGKVHDLLPLQN